MKCITREEPADDTPEQCPETPLPAVMWKVLESSMRVYTEGLTSPVPSTRVASFYVEAWAAGDDTDMSFAFVDVCEAVGLNPDFVRTTMARWREKVAGRDEWPN